MCVLPVPTHNFTNVWRISMKLGTDDMEDIPPFGRLITDDYNTVPP
jgi:hypothetical protein